MQNDIRKISEGGLMCALIGVILLLNRQTAGVFEASFYWILSLPILVYAARYDLKWSIIVSSATLLLSMMISSPATIFYLFSSLVIGVVYGVGVRKKWPNSILLGSVMLFTFFSYVITTFVLSSIFGYNIEETLIEFKVMAESIEQLMGVAFPLGIEKTVLIIAGVTFVVTVVLQSICVHLLAILILRRMKIATNRFKTIFDLHLPKLLAFTTILTVLAYGSVTRLQLSETAIAILTVLYVCLFMLYTGYGVTVAMCYLHKKAKRKYVFFLMLGLFFPPFWILMLTLGIADSFMDLKKRM